jgi:hypothetical protein
MNIGASTSVQDSLKAERDSPEAAFDQSLLQNQNFFVTYGKAYAVYKSKLNVSSVQFRAEPGTFLTTQPALSEIRDPVAYFNSQVNEENKADIAKGKKTALPANSGEKALVIRAYSEGDTPPVTEHRIHRIDSIGEWEYGDGQIDIVFKNNSAFIGDTQEESITKGILPKLVIRSFLEGPPPAYKEITGGSGAASSSGNG